MRITDDLDRRILVVEDEGLIAADIQARLMRLGYPAPVLAGSGEEALARARAAPFDLALMDIHLKGGMDGIATAEALQTERFLPVVYVTAHSDAHTLQRARLSGPFGFIVKPVRDADLRSTIPIALYKAEMDRRLRASEAWLSSTLRSVGEGVVATDTRGGIVFLNPVAEALTGWPAAEAKACPLGEVLKEVAPSGAPADTTLYPRISTLLSRSGARTPVEIDFFSNCADGDRLGSVVVVRDITARQEMERRLIQSQRMEAIASLAGGLAHDFNNQLMLILGYADELTRRLAGEDQKRSREIQQAASIAGSITAQLLTLGRREPGRIEALDVNQVICELQPLLSHSLGKTRILTTNLGTSLGVIRGDRNQLKQAIVNLAFNARDAMPAGGELRLETSRARVDAGTAAARLYAPGTYVRLLVSDTGAGMDSATLARIFEPFFTTKKAGRGTGLGLSMVHSIVAQAGGYINATSEPGKGACFEILLPCQRAARPAHELAAAESSAAETHGRAP